MTYQELKDLQSNSLISEKALGVIEDVIDLRDAEDMDDDADDALVQACDDAFIYYDDAWDYLRDNNVTDFTEAIDEFGCKDVCAIACYYLMQELGA